MTNASRGGRRTSSRTREMMISVNGRENIDLREGDLSGDEQSPVALRHRGHLLRALGTRIRMIAKRELFSIPIFGHCGRAEGERVHLGRPRESPERD